MLMCPNEFDMTLCVVTVKNAALRLLLVASLPQRVLGDYTFFQLLKKAMKVQYWIFETLKSSYSFMPTHFKLLKEGCSSVLPDFE